MTTPSATSETELVLLARIERLTTALRLSGVVVEKYGRLHVRDDDYYAAVDAIARLPIVDEAAAVELCRRRAEAGIDEHVHRCECCAAFRTFTAGKCDICAWDYAAA